MWRLTRNLSFIPWLFSIEGGLIPWLFIIEGGPRLLKGEIKIGFVAFDPKHLFYPWLFSIEGGPRLLKGVTKIGFVAFDPKHLFYPWNFFGIEGGRGGGGQNYWWGKLSEKRAFFGKIFSRRRRRREKSPFLSNFSTILGGGAKPDFAPPQNSASRKGTKTSPRSDQNRYCGV